MMTHRERAALALSCKVPDYVPTFELEFQLAPELCGKDFVYPQQLRGLSGAELEYTLEQDAYYMAEVMDQLGYSIYTLCHLFPEEYSIRTARYMQKVTGGKVMLAAHGDGTFAVPDGNQMYTFAYRIADDPDGLKEEAKRMMEYAIERNKRLMDAGVECFCLCSDYCYNNGPFLSPAMFREFITPYLAGIIRGIRDIGGFAIKHTDGDIMPILDQLLECEPHAIHSLDPMAGVDIAVVKKLCAEKNVAICGNVNCALMQTGTDEEVRESALYALKHGKPGGGYIFTTSNVPFRGMPLDRYQMILDVWREHRDYTQEEQAAGR
jgi:uroporphyrinogen decarboxylase